MTLEEYISKLQAFAKDYGDLEVLSFEETESKYSKPLSFAVVDDEFLIYTNKLWEEFGL